MARLRCRPSLSAAVRRCRNKLKEYIQKYCFLCQRASKEPTQKRSGNRPALHALSAWSTGDSVLGTTHARTHTQHGAQTLKGHSRRLILAKLLNRLQIRVSITAEHPNPRCSSALCQSLLDYTGNLIFILPLNPSLHFYFTLQR